MAPAFLRRIWQVVAALFVWVAFSAPSSPNALMPTEDRVQPFGEQATIGLYASVSEDESILGERPVVIEDRPIIWHLTWNGQSYDVMSEEVPDYKSGTLAFHKLSGTRPLYIAQLSDESAESAPEPHEYFLLWRLTSDEFIGYFGPDPWDCREFPRKELQALGMIEDDIVECKAHNWEQLEGLMRAYAGTEPLAAGTVKRK